MATPLRNALLGVIIPNIMSRVDKEFAVERQTLLKDVRGRVCDVGSGGGAYLRYCAQATHMVAIEPVTMMHGKIRAACSIDSLAIVTALDHIPDKGTFDWIVLGNVLCEVPNVPETLKQIHRLLKPGGYVYFSEHVACPRGTWARTWQDIINPLWRHVAGGCNCNRESISMLRQSNAWTVMDFSYPHVKVCGGHFVLGLAQKKEGAQ